MGKRPTRLTGTPGKGERNTALHSGPAVGAANGQWLTRGKDGKLTLYALAQDGVVRWSETTVGGPHGRPRGVQGVRSGRGAGRFP
ncbi:hypothetical protein STREPTOSP366_52660 [Streptomyces variabilis]